MRWIDKNNLNQLAKKKSSKKNFRSKFSGEKGLPVASNLKFGEKSSSSLVFVKEVEQSLDLDSNLELNESILTQTINLDSNLSILDDQTVENEPCFPDYCQSTS